MNIVAIDPGTTHSGIVLWDGSSVKEACASMPNEEVRRRLLLDWTTQPIACEWVACYGMAVGKEVFLTCRFIGRLEEICTSRDQGIHFITRPEVKISLCHSMRAKDANVRQALIDRLGPVGTKKNPGPLYGVSSHAWSALAVAVAINLA